LRRALLVNVFLRKKPGNLDSEVAVSIATNTEFKQLKLRYRPADEMFKVIGDTINEQFRGDYFHIFAST